jgi:hypothetical protein
MKRFIPTKDFDIRIIVLIEIISNMHVRDEYFK